MGVNKKSGYIERAWYPSGPRLDGKHSETEYKPEPKPPNPDPANYQIIKAKEIGKYLIVQIKYPDCINYEGLKTLLFKDVTLVDLVNQKLIDPHFFKDNKFASPIARFVPTNEGWDYAVMLAESLKRKKK